MKSLGKTIIRLIMPTIAIIAFIVIMSITSISVYFSNFGSLFGIGILLYLLNRVDGVMLRALKLVNLELQVFSLIASIGQAGVGFSEV